MQFSTRPPQSNSVTRFSRWLRWRPLRWGLAGLAAFVPLLGLFYAEENWRGRRAWAAYQRVLQAKGVEFNWHALAPPPVADGNNFAMTPFFAALFDYAPGTHTPRDMTAYNRTAGFAQTGAPYAEQRGGDPVPAMFERRRTDLAGGLQLFTKARPNTPSDARPDKGDRTMAAAAALEELAKFNPVLDELRAASRRPQARFNFSYNEESTWRMTQPHLPVLKRVSTVLTLRASAELASRDASAAADDVHLIITLANSVRDEPFLGSQRARHAMLGNARQIIWEGLADHRWSDRQLSDFQLRLQELSFISDVQKPLRLDQASGNDLFGQLHRNPAMVKSWRFGPGIWNGVFPYFLWLMPSGWMYREQVSYHRSFEEQLLPALDTEAARIRPSLINQAGHGSSQFWNHRLLSDILLQSLVSPLTGAALAQTENNQTVPACALERYRLANGQFPEALDALNPQYLATIPPDLTAGQPMKYRRRDDGRFQLYSIGWNEKDDGGKVVMNKGGKAADVTQGDWVWPQYPEE
jgi:hypothetical protein